MTNASTEGDSATLKAIEAAALCRYQGWEIDRAAELTGADPDEARRCMSRRGTLPFMPTPEQISAMCLAFREHSPRRMVGPQLPPATVATYRFVSHDGAFEPVDGL